MVHSSLTESKLSADQQETTLVISFMKNAPEGSFGHTGFTGTSIVVIPQSGISVILLINRQNIGLLKSGDYYNVGPIRQQVFEAVLKN